ncbi:T9SS type A sorting domain-containing protein [Aquimarina sp. 2201CG1-2-11]|uniref:T9SS type A sorting domain-containing protein n=1 Tax=Aquimarina discodermiae TaxID=3231043 RepID=UPI0034636B45
MKKYILITIVLLTIMQLQAQGIERQVIASSGMTLMNDQVTLDFTIGEIAITTINNESSVLTQGFHQPSYMVITTEPDTPTTFSLYPNPTSGWVIIEGEGVKEINLYSITGQWVFTSNQNSFDISHLSSGVYMAQIETISKMIIKRIVKK